MKTIPVKEFSHPVSYEGICRKKPWEYQVSVSLPVLDHFEQLEVCVELLRLQTVKPYIMIVDTGSDEECWQKVQNMRAEDVEVHCIRANGEQHASDLVAWAVDLNFSMCRTPYMFTTHTDCFLRRRDVLEYFIREMDGGEFAAVGYQISPRYHKDWESHFGHTAAMFHMPTMFKYGITWSLCRLKQLYGLGDWQNGGSSPTWPDTETCMNTLMKAYRLKTKFLGKEENFRRNIDAYIDHVRSLTCSGLFNKTFHHNCLEWWVDAKREAEERIALWRLEVAEEERLRIAVVPDLPSLPGFSRELPKLA